jgi:mono/diheme cytochrome c family protein
MRAVRSSGRAHLSTITLAALLLGGFAAWGLLFHLRTPELTPELRGYALAEELGCHGCHGPRGTGGVRNPRAGLAQTTGEIPAWDGGNAMMYVKSEDEIREWILDGRPWRLVLRDSLAARATRADSDTTSPFPEPGRVELRPSRLAAPKPPVRMPAYRGVVDERQLEDLVAYYKAVAVFGDDVDAMSVDARQGYAVARDTGCFGCHGPGGRLGAKNPRSFKGYVPPWHGPDFHELVHHDDELRAWILDGAVPRISENRVGRWFLSRQVVKMPAYRGVLADSSVDDVMSYIKWMSREENTTSSR